MLNQRSLILKHIYIYEGNGNPLQYSCLENSMDRGAWWVTVYGITKSQTRLSDWVCTCVHTHTHTHTRTHICSHSYFSWGSWQTTLVFLLQESHRQYEKTKRCNTRRWAPPRSKGVQYAIREERRLLAIINSSRESDTTEVTQQQQQP